MVINLEYLELQIHSEYMSFLTADTLTSNNCHNISIYLWPVMVRFCPVSYTKLPGVPSLIDTDTSSWSNSMSHTTRV